MRAIRDFFRAFMHSIQGQAPNAVNQNRPAGPFSLNTQQRESDVRMLTSVLDWDWNRFRNILISLASLGQGRHIPADRRPDSIRLDVLRSTIRELRYISQQRAGRETSRVIFADQERMDLIVSGKTAVGTQTSTKIIMTPEPGREFVQSPVLGVHIHPENLTAGGFSDVDYVSFLSEKRMVGMVLHYREGVFMALKTTATRSQIDPDSLNRLVAAIRKEFLEGMQIALNPRQAILDFNKTVCLEFGLTLYHTVDVRDSLVKRIAVVA